MTKFMNAIGDRMLNRVLPKNVAGACIPEFGTKCGCKVVSSRCIAPNSRSIVKRWYKWDCYGRCKVSSADCGSQCVVDYAC